MTYMQIKYDTNELSLVTVLDAQFTMTYIEEDIHIQIKDRVISDLRGSQLFLTLLLIQQQLVYAQQNADTSQAGPSNKKRKLGSLFTDSGRDYSACVQL